MMRQLQTIDSTKAVYDTPEACLQVFAREFARIRAEEQQYKVMIRELNQDNTLLKQDRNEHEQQYQAKVQELLSTEVGLNRVSNVTSKRRKTYGRVTEKWRENTGRVRTT